MIEGLRPYGEYTVSDIPSVARIPAQWSILPLRRLGRFIRGQGGSKADNKETGVACVRYGEMYTRFEFHVRRPHTFVSPEVAKRYTPLLPGDVIFALSGETIEDIGSSAENFLDEQTVCGGDAAILRPVGGFSPGFLGYACRSRPTAIQKAWGATGTTVKHTSISALGEMLLAIPPPDEQAAIVRFLDHANRRIDRYIRAKRKLIALLNEQKQAIIHRAVTRGLDPGVKMKDSGVPWLGMVPSHWEVTRLDRATDPDRPIMYGIVLPGPNVDDGVWIVKGGNCEEGRLRPERLSRTTRAIESGYTRSRLQTRDLVIAIRGGVGALQMVPAWLAGANLTQDAARIAPRVGVEPRWLLQLLRSPILQEHIQAKVVGATVRGINIRDLKRLAIILPPHEEQVRIASAIEKQTAEQERGIEIAERELNLLREYRARLISDVVTGQLDVREAARGLPEVEEDIEATVAEEADAGDGGDEAVEDAA